MANPAYQHARGDYLENRRSWVENEDRTFLPTRNEYNEDLEVWEYEEWHLNLETGDVIVEHNSSHHLTFKRMVDILLAVGFNSVSFMDTAGRPYMTGTEEPRNYFCVAQK